ncbi:substrate-binding domain-containing protein [Roseomonas sp. NAR14]|uniref:Substrate-binding domain-containing protein n=1 Tax=Roseomonas acroporae TaxID=2937791 RepID=A0A9X2BVX6_9PROT|nr:substrate-binding domain-containing protein [Roseomonas acroporae]MCK8787108.1 substrate-binding domain-containing protein [Roseomonas acroporae]
MRTGSLPRRAALALCLGAGLSTGAWSGAARAAEPIRILAAGSLGAVLPELIAAAGLPADAVAPPVFGPAGVLGERLRNGEAADLFASADLAQPRAVAAQRPGTLVVPFARNRMCVVAPARLGLTEGNLLERLLSPGLRLAASTPGADPGGDYARAVFARAEALHPGAQAALTAKTRLLLGGPGSMTPQPGHSPAATIFLGDHADALLYYCSGTAAVMREVPGLAALPVPDALEPGPVYGLAILTGRPEAARLALFMLSAPGQEILRRGGLLPLVGER